MTIHSLSAVSAPDPDSIRESKKLPQNRRATDILLQAQHCWMAFDRFRRDRERNKRYNYGDQWGDLVCVDGITMTEEQYLLRQGRVPLKNNLIRRLVRNILGIFRSQASEPTCFARDRDEQSQAETMSTVLQCNMQLNRADELNARSLEEFLISGFIVHRKWYGWRNGLQDCWTDYVQPNNFFCDHTSRDFRFWDLSLVGEIHDISFDELCSRFAHSPADYTNLAQIYQTCRHKSSLANSWAQFSHPDLHNFSFLIPADHSRCRVFEIWRRETKPRYRCHDLNTGEVFKCELSDLNALVNIPNTQRLALAQSAGMRPDDVPLIQAEWFIDSFWYYYFITPTGQILDEGETPYEHASHPYVIKAYPFIDGEVHSFVADIIDQQRYTNRLITLYDFIMQSSAKGVLMIPEDSIPKNMTPADFADEWTRHNGVIVYTPSKYGAAPHQIANNSTNIGITDLLNIQMRLLEDISGVNGALQGKPGFSGMSASLYAQQMHNASTSLLDILDSFFSFQREGALKDIKNIQQYYDPAKIRAIAGASGKQLSVDPDRIRELEFDLTIAPSTTTPVYRSLANDVLMEIWRAGQITLEQMLKAGAYPFADELLQSIKARDQEMQQQQMLQQQMLRQAAMQQQSVSASARNGQPSPLQTPPPAPRLETPDVPIGPFDPGQTPPPIQTPSV